jgi:hypothetical protein
MRQPLPTRAAAYSTPQRSANEGTYKNGNGIFSPIESLMTALGYGKTIWTKVNNLPLLDALPLIDLTFLLEEHIQNLYELCKFDSKFPTDDSILLDLHEFYTKQELTQQLNKRGHSLREVFLAKATQETSITNYLSTNYYKLLEVHEDSCEEEYTSTSTKLPNRSSQLIMKEPESSIQTSFPEDLNITEVETSIRHRQAAVAMDEDVEDDPHQNPLPHTPPRIITITTSDASVPSNIRINLIRHKNAVVTEKTSLQLFKTFIVAAKKTDPNLTVLPIDSTKQHLSSLTSFKQVENLTTNQLRLYFSPWFRDQPHSLSGFLHLNTILEVGDMMQELPLAEWLATYQYSVKPCKSQVEEMSIIGALCYGSLFLHRDGLLDSIQSLPEWVQLNQGRDTPIIIDLVIKPFKGPGKSADMIFMRSERSKREEATKFFLKLYDGTPKRYPRGDMLFFIPVTSKLEAEYTDAQRSKYLFNHQAYLGDEDCLTIFGLADLETKLILKDGRPATIRTLLKSLPATEGMSRSRLFQVVDFVPSQNCVLVTFQRSDRPLVEERQFGFEVELSDQLSNGEVPKLYVDEMQGLRFGSAYHKNKGKVIRIHNPSQTHLDFVQYADRMLSSPPKKRTNAEMKEGSVKSTHSAGSGSISYSGVLQAQTTRTRSVAAPNGITTTTTTQTSKTVMAVMETRFQNIEEEQKSLKHRLSNVETRTMTTDDNIRIMMAHWKINPTPMKRKHIEGAEDEENDSAAGNAILPVTTPQGQGAQYF